MIVFMRPGLAVMRTMLESREFFSEGAFRSKLKTPLEVVASAVR